MYKRNAKAWAQHSRRTAMERPGPVTIIVAPIGVPATTMQPVAQPARRAVLAHVRATLQPATPAQASHTAALLAANEQALKDALARKGSKDWNYIDQLHANIQRLGGGLCAEAPVQDPPPVVAPRVQPVVAAFLAYQNQGA